MGMLAAIIAVVFVWNATHSHSDFYRAVKADPTWLAFLPNDGTGLDLEVVGLNSENAAGVAMRRVDIMDSTHEETASLCFAATKAAVLRACPGTTYLGMSRRDGLELRAVSQIAPSGSSDWLDLLSSPTPDLEDLDYLE